MGGLLAGKRVLVTGVLMESSIAFHTARLAQREGAEAVLTGYGRMGLVERVAARLPDPAPVLELDVRDPAHLADLVPRVRELLGADARLDGAVHSIAFAPPDALGGGFLNTPWESVATALEVSAYSLRSLAHAVLPLMRERGGALVGLDFDSRIAWPAYDWMGVAKAALESTSRYVAREVGAHRVRCNLVAAGPVRTTAARSIPGFDLFREVWEERAPLGWDVRDPEPAARAVTALLSDWFPKTTGEIVHVDGGVHAVGG
ncbi:enoyl-[acyl-carrier-protein] reductase FabI [Streptomyces sp. AJS327]|uniref:enoyl-ACP reductase FabI n=1 Tax=Streptomyces sp. AJS327 TaxID=2545265 RepID=UPI0015DE56E0|nr:enoyl-ACP reductase FabI [Streptomyces sp. AJS327]MBA0052870.1 enoyl-[acyl-carrier-protein] reductase FabI [Streptomyces sp. AJS327]